eukprot:gene6135-biopygen8771
MKYGICMDRHRDDEHSAIPSGYYVEDLEFILNYYASALSPRPSAVSLSLSLSQPSALRASPSTLSPQLGLSPRPSALSPQPQPQPQPSEPHPRASALSPQSLTLRPQPSEHQPHPETGTRGNRGAADISARARYCRQRWVSPHVRFWRNTGNKKPCEIDLNMCGSRSWPAPQDDAHGCIVLIIHGIRMDRHRDDAYSKTPSGYYVWDL